MIIYNPRSGSPTPSTSVKGHLYDPEICYVKDSDAQGES